MKQIHTLLMDAVALVILGSCTITVIDSGHNTTATLDNNNSVSSYQSVPAINIKPPIVSIVQKSNKQHVASSKPITPPTVVTIGCSKFNMPKIEDNLPLPNNIADIMRTDPDKGLKLIVENMHANKEMYRNLHSNLDTAYKTHLASCSKN